MRQFIIKCSRAVLGWPPAPATFLEKQTLITRKAGELELKVFIETGTYLGEMIEAQRPYFKKIISIELNAELFRAACTKYSGNPQIQLFQGDSGVVLHAAVQELDEPALFWLDAHYSRGNTAGEDADAPILKELSCLTARNQPRDTILIDDARLFGRKSGYPKLEVIRQFAAQHWPEHICALETDVICIQPRIRAA